MAELPIKVGDIVSFKSHLKLKMTVEHIFDNEATVIWFHHLTFDFQRQHVKLDSIIKND